MEAKTTRMTGQEKFYSCNTLVCLLQALKGLKTTVELRNEAEVYGTIDNVDGYMNTTVTGATFTDPAGSRATFDSFFVHGRQIRYVHIPDEVSPLSAIRRQLQVNQGCGRGGRREEISQMRRSRRTKKAEAYTRETVRALNRPGPSAPAPAAAPGSAPAVATTTRRSAPAPAKARAPLQPGDDTGFV